MPDWGTKKAGNKLSLSTSAKYHERFDVIISDEKNAPKEKSSRVQVML
jgi:hypothetical protein